MLDERGGVWRERVVRLWRRQAQREWWLKNVAKTEAYIRLLANVLQHHEGLDAGGPLRRRAIDEARDDSEEARRKVVASAVVESQGVGDEESASIHGQGESMNSCDEAHPG